MVRLGGFELYSRWVPLIKLTPDEMHAISMDIFKPLDFFEMFYERLKAQEKEKEKEELDEERIR